jgi:hypothetical protein
MPGKLEMILSLRRGACPERLSVFCEGVEWPRAQRSEAPIKICGPKSWRVSCPANARIYRCLEILSRIPTAIYLICEMPFCAHFPIPFDGPITPHDGEWPDEATEDELIEGQPIYGDEMFLYEGLKSRTRT